MPKTQNQKQEKQQKQNKNKDKNKQKLGQFYTTNYDYILQGLNVPKSINHVIEPFAGQGDLVNFSKTYPLLTIEAYDIDPKKDYIKRRDTLLHPPNYSDKFVITNPPYLARNKSQDKTVFDKYRQNDLYKCFIDELTRNHCIGGILIIPLNFWCSIRKNDISLRETFLKTYKIARINIFEERVFNDTSYTVCSFQFELKDKLETGTSGGSIDCVVYPQDIKYSFSLNETNNFTIGGEIYNLSQDKSITVERLTKKNKNSKYATNILVKCIDDSIKSKIRLSIVSVENRYIDMSAKLSARSYATLLVKPKITKEQAQMLVEKFNVYLNSQRDKYNSLFLSNYRESNTIARKRISFKLVFKIVNYLLNLENQV